MCSQTSNSTPVSRPGRNPRIRPGWLSHVPATYITVMTYDTALKPDASNGEFGEKMNTAPDTTLPPLSLLRSSLLGTIAVRRAVWADERRHRNRHSQDRQEGACSAGAFGGAGGAILADKATWSTMLDEPHPDTTRRTATVNASPLPTPATTRRSCSTSSLDCEAEEFYAAVPPRNAPQTRLTAPSHGSLVVAGHQQRTPAWPPHRILDQRRRLGKRAS